MFLKLALAGSNFSMIFRVRLFSRLLLVLFSIDSEGNTSSGYHIYMYVRVFLLKKEMTLHIDYILTA